MDTKEHESEWSAAPSGNALKGHDACSTAWTRMVSPIRRSSLLPSANARMHPVDSTATSRLQKARTSPLHYPQLGVEFRPIPKGLCPAAQGCEARATLGVVEKQVSTPTELSRLRRIEDATPLGLRRIPLRFPKVARASQPWATGRTPVGIQSPGARKMWVMQRTSPRTPKAVASAPQALNTLVVNLTSIP